MGWVGDSWSGERPFYVGNIGEILPIENIIEY